MNVSTTVSLTDFFPKYPVVDNVSFNQSIYNKREFNELKLDRVEDRPIDGGLYKHQQVISRFLSSHTPYTGLLLLHEMGTGKTCALFGATEQIKSEGGYKRAVIMTRNPHLLQNLKNELAYKCTQKIYSPEEQNITDLEKRHRINKLTSVFYKFVSFDNMKKNLRALTDAQIVELYSNSFFGIDEVHNLKLYGEGDNTSSDDYNQIHRLLHIAKNIKVLLLSGTPMTDHPREIAQMLNLILPSNKQLPTGKKFTEEFLYEKNGINYVRDNMKSVLKDTMRGRVSYLKTTMPDVSVIYEGEIYKGLQLFKIVRSVMSDFQTRFYVDAYKKDIASKADKTDESDDDEEDDKNKGKKVRTAGVYSNSRQSTLFVFPDGSAGNKGFDKYVIFTERKVLGAAKQMSYKLSQELKDELRGKNNEETINNIRKYSATYADTIQSILENPTKLHFIYGKLIVGSGNILFGCLLELVGYTRGSISSTSVKPSYFNLTKKIYSDDQIKNILAYYSSPANMNGKLSNVLISSKILSEGFTIKNIQRIHVLTPHWNYSELAQAIARGIRLNAHNDLINAGQKPEIKIYLHAAIPNDNSTSLDLTKYIISEQKDVAMKDVERLIKESAVDCALFRDRNTTEMSRENSKENSKENSRECEYQSCRYECDGITNYDLSTIDIDYSTYNLYYSDRDVESIINQLRVFFTKRFSCYIDTVIATYTKKGFRTFAILKAVTTMIDQNYEIKNRYNIISYLREENNVLFLIDSISINSVFSPCSYTKFPAVKDSMAYSEALNDMCITEICRATNINKYLAELSLFVKQYICEEVIHNKLTSELSSKITAYFNITKNKYTIDGTTYSLGRIVVAKEKLPSPERVPIVQAEHGYSGKYNENFFCIKKYEDVEDVRAKPTGRTCPQSWHVDQLCRIAVELKLPYGNKSQKYDNISLMSKDKLLTEIGKTKLRDYMTEFSVLLIDDLRRVLFFASSPKQISCNAIRKHFLENNLLEYNETCGKTGVLRTKE